MKKVLSTLLILTLLISLTACGQKETTDTADTADKAETTNTEKDEIVTLKYFTFSAAPDHLEELDSMIAEFEKQNPNIKVTYETAAWGDYFTKLQSLVAGGMAPDTFELNYENFVTYAANGSLYNMDELIKGDSEFDSSVYNKSAFDAFKYDGSQYGLVENFSNVLLYYNKELFDAKGVDYPNPSWTWEDELAAAQKLTDAEAGIWGTFAPIQFWEFYKTIEQNGGSILNEDMTECVVNSPQNVETLQWMIDKIEKYNVTPSDEQMSGQSDGDLFKAGKIAMLRTGIWMFSGFADTDFEWDIALEPGNTQKAHHFFANGVAISADSEHPEEAWLWSNFLTSSAEATKIRVDASWELPAVTDEAVLQSYLDQPIPASREVVFQALDTLVVPPVIQGWNELSDAIGKELDQAKFGIKTAQEALDDAKVVIDQFLK